MTRTTGGASTKAVVTKVPKAPKVFDLSELATRDTIDVEIMDPREMPNEVPIGITITLHSPLSRAGRTLETDPRCQIKHKTDAAGAVTLDMTMEAFRDAVTQRAILYTIGWRSADLGSGPGLPEGVAVRGEELPCTPENRERIFAREFTWMPMQLLSATQKVRDFFVNPKRS